MGQGPKVEKGGKVREKGWEERGPKAPSKNSEFGTPMIYLLFSGLPSPQGFSVLQGCRS